MSRFAGFRPDAVHFYRALEKNNNRHWWEANKDIFVHEVRLPMEQLMAELGSRYGQVKVFDPQRDVHTSDDKTPYKNHQGAYAASPAGFAWYVHLDSEGLMVGGGAWVLSPDQVQRYREAVEVERSGRRLASIVSSLREEGYSVGGDQLPDLPEGTAAESKRPELLRLRNLHASRHEGNQPWLSRRDALQHVHEQWELLRPLIRWFDEHVGPAAQP